MESFKELQEVASSVNSRDITQEIGAYHSQQHGFDYTERPENQALSTQSDSLIKDEFDKPLQHPSGESPNLLDTGFDPIEHKEFSGIDDFLTPKDGLLAEKSSIDPGDLLAESYSPKHGSVSPELVDKRSPSPDVIDRGSVSPPSLDIDKNPSPFLGHHDLADPLILDRSPSPETPDRSFEGPTKIPEISSIFDSSLKADIPDTSSSAAEPFSDHPEKAPQFTHSLLDEPDKEYVEDLSSDEEKDTGIDYMQRDPSPEFYKSEIPSLQTKTEPFYSGDLSKSEPLYSDDISKSEAIDDFSKSEALFSDDFEKESSTTSDVTKEASPLPEIFQKEASPVESYAQEPFPVELETDKAPFKTEATLGAKQFKDSPYEPQNTPEPELLMDSPRSRDSSPERTTEPDYPTPAHKEESDDGQNSPFEKIDPEKELHDYFQESEQLKEAEVKPGVSSPPAPETCKSTMIRIITFNYAWLQKLPPRVLDLIYWRDTKKSGAVYGAGMMFLLLLRWMSLISVISYMSLATLTATLSFRIYKNVMQAIQKTQDGHPFKEFLEVDVTIPADKVQQTTDVALKKLNCAVHELRRLFLVEDFVDTLKFAILLWCCTYIGAWFNSLTLIIIAYAGLFTLPKVYEVNQVQIDQYIDLVRKHIEDITTKIRSVIPLGGSKEKAQ